MNYYIIYKPFGMLSQFTREVAHHITLADLDFEFEKDVYPVGRLDRDSEGLLILTNDKALNHRLLNPQFAHQRTYLVQVEGIPTQASIDKLRGGIIIRINKKDHTTLPAVVEVLESTPVLPERNPPIRFRKNKPTTWVKITLTEGKNRQVRRMLAKVGYPVLRLVRYSIEGMNIDEMKNGDVKSIDKAALDELLKL